MVFVLIRRNSINLWHMKKFISYFLLSLIPAGLFAQQANKPDIRPSLPSSAEVKSDTVKKAATTKKERITRLWTLTPDYTNEVPVTLDTAFSLFHRSRMTDKLSDFNIYPGNYGQPLYQLNYFERPWQPDQHLYSHYRPYMFTPSNPVFVNTQVPFTEFVFTFAGVKSNAEQTFHLRHSQNVNKDLNFGFIYNIVYSVGQYAYQNTKDKNFLFHSSYNGEKYTAYLTAGINNLNTFENGGIETREDLESFKNKPENVQTLLNASNEAKNILKNRHIMLIQRYSPGVRKDTSSADIIKNSPVTFSLISSYEWSKRKYVDEMPESTFYDTIIFDDRSTSDTLFQGLLSNTFRIDISAGGSGKFRIGAGAGIRSEIRRFGQIVPGEIPDTWNCQLIHFGELGPGEAHITPDTTMVKKGSLVLTGKIFNNIGEKFGWVATGDLWFQGYRAGDFVVDGRIFKDFTTSRGNITWDATGTMASYTPSYWYSSWTSNSLSRKFDVAREVRIMAGSSISYPAIKAGIRFNYAIIDNFIYFDKDDNPAQHAGALSIASLCLKKEFVVWKFHWDNSVMLQQSSNSDVLSLPLGAGKSALFFDHTFRFASTNGSFDFQLGAEVFYHTPYYASAYMPVTGDYYNQSTSKTGNYPFVNAFLNLKLKRTRFYIMFDHLNSGYSGFDYFLIPDYPMNNRMLRYGLAWTFYN